MTESLIREATMLNEHHGLRSDVALAMVFPEFSRSQLSHWLKQGLITFNSLPHHPKDKLLGGEHVCMRVLLTEPVGTAQPENIPLEVVFEDEHLLVINKPCGLVVHPGAGQKEHTLVNALLHHEPTLNHLPRAGIVHRLDKETTGLLIVAKTLSAHTALIRQMQAREIQRQYKALVHGHLISGGTIDTCYGRHPRNRLKMAVCESGKQAITQYLVNQHINGFTLLDVTLMTGRTHQIRVHMAHINHPIVGDPLYNLRGRVPANLSSECREALRSFKRQALHAGFLSFEHPVSHNRLTLTAPLPNDFQSLLSSMEVKHV